MHKYIQYMYTYMQYVYVYLYFAHQYRSHLQSNEKVCSIVFTDAEVGPFEVDKGHSQEILMCQNQGQKLS